MKKILILFVIAIAISGCADDNEVHKITVDNVNYQFVTNILESQNVTIENSTYIRNLVKDEDNINIFFDPNKGDEAIVQEVGINIVVKIQYFYRNVGWEKNFETYFLNETSVEDVNGANIWIKGPNTGGNQTKVYLYNNNTIVVEGDTNQELRQAADRLSLTVIGVDKL